MCTVGVGPPPGLLGGGDERLLVVANYGGPVGLLGAGARGLVRRTVAVALSSEADLLRLGCT